MAGRSTLSLGSTVEIAPDRKQWFELLRLIAKGEATVHAYLDESETTTIDIFRSVDPTGSLLATIGLMDIDQSRNPAVTVNSEILLDSRSTDEKLGNILSTISFYIIKNGWRVAPDIVFEQMVEMYFPGHPLPHVIFVPPFRWDSGMDNVQLKTRTIYPLVAVPISEAERLFSASRPPRALEALWEAQHVDVYDWNRASAA